MRVGCGIGIKGGMFSGGIHVRLQKPAFNTDSRIRHLWPADRCDRGCRTV